MLHTYRSQHKSVHIIVINGLVCVNIGLCDSVGVCVCVCVCVCEGLCLYVCSMYWLDRCHLHPQLIFAIGRCCSPSSSSSSSSSASASLPLASSTNLCHWSLLFIISIAAAAMISNAIQTRHRNIKNPTRNHNSKEGKHKITAKTRKHTITTK